MPGAPHLGRHRRLDRAEPFDRIGQMRREVRVQRDDAVAERPMFVTAVGARRIDDERRIGKIADCEEMLTPRGARKGQEDVVDRPPLRSTPRFPAPEREAYVALTGPP